MTTIRTHTEEETLRLGEVVGQLLAPGSVVSLVAPLGAGKTWLSKGIAKGVAGHDYDSVNSPAFNLVHEYVADDASPKIFHIDFYRLDELTPEDVQMFEEYLIDDSVVALVEWGNKFLDSIVDDYLLISIERCADDESCRQFAFETVGDGQRYSALINYLDSTC